MYNLVHMYVAVLKQLEIISEEGAKELSRELSTKILPSNPEDAMFQVEQAVKAVEHRLSNHIKMEPWLDRINELERKVQDLELLVTKEVVAKKALPKANKTQTIKKGL